jgi:NACHT domain
MQHEPICLPDTRVGLLREIYNWADGQDERSIFWLNGLAGTGKSTIARTVARHYFDKGHLGASFFFSRGGGDVSRANKFVTSIAVQLAISIPALRQYVSDTVIEYSDIASRSLLDQWRELVLRPLSKLDGNDCQSLYVVVVDALDECDSGNDIQIILNLLAEVRSLEKVRLRVFLTSRPEVPVRNGFIQIPGTEHQDFVLHNISPSIVDYDICIFLKHNLNLIAQERSLAAGWPGEQIIKRLIQSASGLFIWAATACRFIREGKQFAVRRLDTILKHSSTTINAPEEHLDKIYLTVLRHCISPDFANEEAEELRSMLRRLLGSIVTLLSPLSTQSLSRLLSTPYNEVDQTVDDLHAILDIPKDPNRPLRIHHPSFRDFILNSDRCSDPNFWVDKKQAHQTLADNCIRLMSASLKQDICGLGVSDILTTDIKRSQKEQYLSPELQYACLYWVEHLQKSNAKLRDNDQVYQFLQNHLLHWLEALGWMRKVSEGIYAIASLESIAAVSQSEP